ncbi:MAG: ATP-binding protein [Peptostreptococcaceae bacterium]
MLNILDVLEDYIVILHKNYQIKFCNKKVLSKLRLKQSEISKIKIDIEKQNLNIGERIRVSLLSEDSRETLTMYSQIVLDEFKGEESIFLVGRDICEKSYKREDLEKILENIPINCWLKNMNGEYVYVNESYAKELGDEQLNILGKHTREYWDEYMSNNFTQMDKEVVESKKFQLTESYTKQQGSELWVEIYKAPILDEKNNVEYILGYTKDITLNKKLETEMLINNKEMNNLNNILINTNSKNNINELLKGIGENVKEHFRCDSVSIFLLDKESSRLNQVMYCGKEAKCKYYEQMLQVDIENLDKMVLEENLNNIKNIKDVKNEVVKKYMINNDIENVGVYIISFNEEIIGFLTLKYLKNNTLRFNRFDYLKTISSNIATMIKSHTLSEQVKEEFEKRRIIEKQLELFLDISVDLIATGSLDGNIKYINNNWSKTLGWSENELLKMNINEIIEGDFRNEFENIANDPINNTGFSVYKIRCKNNTFKWIEINYKVLKDEDKFLITAKDVTEQKIQEEERKNLKEAVQMETLKNEFFANISHEFRTPLNIILGTMQLMQRNVENGKISWNEKLNLESHINYIKQNSYRLLRLVNNLIDITSIESGYYQLQLGNYNIVDIVENITLSVAQYTKEQGINLIFDTNCEEKIIACDPEKIERVVLNLLSNATKYTDKNGCIYVDLIVEDNIIKVSVKDDGVGISEDKLDIIFDRFKKIDNSLNRKCEGSGIGLSLVKSLVELQNGNIYVESKLGEGSKFTFELPTKLIDESLQVTLNREISKSSQIEKCNIEFSDIYS